MNTAVIQVNAVTKQYKLYNAPVDRLKEALHPFGKKYHRAEPRLKGLQI